MDILEWIQNWYQSHCDGDWEHSGGILIGTIDNPGWRVIIDLKDTELENLHLDYALNEKSANDWYAIKIENNKFEGHCDPTKLKFLLNKFKEIVEKND